MKTNCKLVNVPSGIAPAKQAWIPIINKYETINAAQPSKQNNWHIPLIGGKGVKLKRKALA